MGSARTSSTRKMKDSKDMASSTILLCNHFCFPFPTNHPPLTRPPGATPSALIEAEMAATAKRMIELKRSLEAKRKATLIAAKAARPPASTASAAAKPSSARPAPDTTARKIDATPTDTTRTAAAGAAKVRQDRRWLLLDWTHSAAAQQPEGVPTISVFSSRAGQSDMPQALFSRSCSQVPSVLCSKLQHDLSA